MQARRVDRRSTRPRRASLSGKGVGSALAVGAIMALTTFAPGAAASEPEAHSRSGARDAALASALVQQRPLVTPQPDRAVITLTTITPTVVTGDTDVVISGTVTAPLSGPLAGLRLNAVLGGVDLSRREAIDIWSRGTSHANGTTLGSVSRPDVPAGQSADFTISLPAGTVVSREAFDALPLAIEAVQSGASTPTGVTRTFLAWQGPRKEYEPLEIATALPVTLDPAVGLFSSDTATRDDAWTAAIGPDSRIRRILDGTKGSVVTLAVDPSVFGPSRVPFAGSAASAGSPNGTPTTPTAPATTSAATSAATGATPTSPPTTPTNPPPTNPPPTTTDDHIRGLSDGIVAELTERSIWALPYADADLAAGVTLDPTNPLLRDLVNRASLVSTSLKQPARADIAWPIDGLLPAGREAGLRTLYAGTSVTRPRAIVVNERDITSASNYTPTARRVTGTGTRLLSYDPRLSALLPKRGDATPVLAIQRYLAETLVLLGERPGTPRSVFVAGTRTYDPDPAALAAFLKATSSVPWITTVEPASLLTDRGGDTALVQQKPAAAVGSAAPRPALTALRLGQLAHQRDTLLRVAAVLADGAVFEATYREILDELASNRWRYQPAAWAALNTSVAAETRAATSAIKVVPSSVNFLAEKGTLLITVVNGLDFAVEDIRLHLTPTNPRVQVVTQPGPLTIKAGSSRAVRVPVAAVAVGRVDIRAFLTTADGTPIGSEATITVSANPLDRTIYLVGGILVGIVLLAGVIRTVRKGTSRIDEIGDLDTVAQRHEAGEDG